MKRKLVAAICIACLLVLCGWIYNRYFAYVMEYNIGNFCYRDGRYFDASDWYTKALGREIPQEKECSVRINTALAQIAMLDDDYDQPDKVDDSIRLLEGARDVLLGDNCATEEGNGHSQKAEQLKEEIDKVLEELKESQETDTGDGGEDTPDSEDGNTEEADIKEQNIRQKIVRMQENANQDRAEEEQFLQELDLEINFDYEGDIW